MDESKLIAFYRWLMWLEALFEPVLCQNILVGLLDYLTAMNKSMGFTLNIEWEISSGFEAHIDTFK